MGSSAAKSATVWAAVAVGLFLLWQSPVRRRVITFGRCGMPLTYRIGRIDPNFKLSPDDLRASIQVATSLWGKAGKRKLFEENETDGLPINLVYDERQIKSEDSEQNIGRIEAGSSSYGDLRRQYDALTATVLPRKAAYERRVAQVNDGQRITPEEYRALEQERLALEQLFGQINLMSSELNALAISQKTIAEAVNRDNEKPWTAGDYDPASRRVNIYQYRNRDELALKLAHELGHALGMGHVQNEKSVMYYLSKRENEIRLEPTAEDIAELERVCSISAK